MPVAGASRLVHVSPTASLTSPAVRLTVETTVPAMPISASTLLLAGSPPRLSACSSGGRMKKTSTTDSTAAMISCSHHGAPKRPESRPPTLPIGDHQEHEIEGQHLDDDEDQDEDEPDDPGEGRDVHERPPFTG